LKYVIPIYLFKKKTDWKSGIPKKLSLFFILTSGKMSAIKQ